MNRNLLFLVIGLVAGLLLAFLFQMVAVRPEVGTGEVGYGELSKNTAALEKLSSRLEGMESTLIGEISSLKAEVRDIREESDVRLSEEFEEALPGKERIPPSPQETAVKPDVRKLDSSWISLLDKDIATVSIGFRNP